MYRILLVVVAVVAVTAVVSAGAPPCPARCSCPVSDELEYLCSAGGGPGGDEQAILLQAQLDTYANIDCQGSNISCEYIPKVDLARGAILPSVLMKSCSPSMLSCMLGAVRAAGVNTLILKSPLEAPTADDLRVLDLHTLMFYDAKPILRVPSDALRALPALKSLRINGAPLQLWADDFLGSGNLTFLELSADSIARVPEHAFRGLHDLRQLLLWMNDVENVTQGSFEGLDSLEKLDLSSNALRDLEPGVFASMPRMRSLFLDRNRLERLNEGVLTGQLLENITLTSNRAQLSLGSKAFANLPSLRNLYLNYSSINTVPADLFHGSTNMTTLVMNHNELAELPEAIFEGLKAIEILDLSYNRITELSSNVFLPLKGLKELDLSRNYIEVLPELLFSGMPHFRTFTIDDNFLHTISERTFVGASSLETVSMVNNRLTLVPPPLLQVQGYGSLDRQSPFRYLVKLKRLLLQGNRITQVFGDWMTVLLQLTELDLSRNKINLLTDYELQFINNRITVDLRNNNISSINIPDVLYPGPLTTTASQNQVLLDNNPFDCDCGLYPLSLILRGGYTLASLPTLDVGNARCASPTDKTGQILRTIPPEHFTCELPNCPESCFSCLMRPFSRSLEYNCKFMPKTLPDPSESFAKHIILRLHNITGVNSLPDTVQTLNLTNIGLQQVPVLNHSLEVLDLRYNDIEHVPNDILASNVSLYLSHNPIDCDCWSKNSIEAILSSKNVVDYSKVTCSDGREVVDIDVSRLCSVRNASIAAGATFILLIFIVFMLGSIIYRYNREILVYLSTRGYCSCLFSENILDADKPYDVFVSYAHQDEKFVVDRLIPKLEDGFKLRVCVHYRDWVVGDLIPTQIVRSVENSRRTVVVLSRNFLASMWAGLEFRAAHMKALREGRARVLLIILEDEALSDAQLDEEMLAYLNTNTYLKFDDPRFWERLQRALPPRGTEFILFKQLRERGGKEKTAVGGLDVRVNSEGKLVNAALEKDLV